MSVTDKALRILADRRIRYLGTRWEFEVIGESGDPFAKTPYRVSLLPKPSCTCPASPSRRCSHIIAAQLALAVFSREEASE